jgi:PAS domain S-box-containing protein/putative nucleotidyltransferase with HDIG domain
MSTAIAVQTHRPLHPHSALQLRFHAELTADACMEMHGETGRAADGSGTHLAEIAGTIAEVLWVSDPDTTRISYVSPAYERLTGRSSASLYSNARSFLESVHPDDRGIVLAAIERQAAGLDHSSEVRIVRPDGEIRWVWNRGYPVLDPVSKTVSHFVGIASDITEQHADAFHLQLLRALIDHSCDVIAVLDAVTLQIVDINDTASLEWGLNREQLQSMSIDELCAPLAGSRRIDLLAEISGSGRARFESTIRRGDGTAFIAEIRVKRVSIGHPFLVASIQDISQRRRLESSMNATIAALASTLELRDPYTSEHQKKVSTLSVAIARQLGMSEERCRGLELAALVHDIGKIIVPAEILAKPGRISKAEMDLIRGHADAGYEILKNVDFPWPVAQIVRQHHERLDGSGYPLGLKGDEILLESRILAVADVVEAMESHRPYRAARGIDAALDELMRGRGGIYDPEVVDAALALYNRTVPGEVASRGSAGTASASG